MLELFGKCMRSFFSEKDIYNYLICFISSQTSINNAYIFQNYNQGNQLLCSLQIKILHNVYISRVNINVHTCRAYYFQLHFLNTNKLS